LFLTPGAGVQVLCRRASEFLYILHVLLKGGVNMGEFYELLDKLFPNFTNNIMKMTLVISGLILLLLILVKAVLYLNIREEKKLEELLQKKYKE